MTTDETGPGLVIGIMTEDVEEIEIATGTETGIEVERKAEMMTKGTSLEGTCILHALLFSAVLRNHFMLLFSAF